jgi:hypothetical protein
MTLYFVLYAQVEDRLAVLYDSFGMYHLTRSAADLPTTGTELHGAPPHSGLNLLHGSDTGQVYRLLFEEPDCGQSAAFDRLPGRRVVSEEIASPPWPHAGSAGAVTMPVSRA